MAKTMSPSRTVPITTGQIAKFQELLAAELRKRALPSEPVQYVLETYGGRLAKKFVDKVSERVQSFSDRIIRGVRVNRALSARQQFEKAGYYGSGCILELDDRALDCMPTSKGEVAEVHFFTIDHEVRNTQLLREYAKRGLRVDPTAHAQVYYDDYSFYEHCSISTWKGPDGTWYSAHFGRKAIGERLPFLDVSESHMSCWGSGWRFAGVLDR